MTEEEMDTLVEDVRANGLIEPIWLHDGQIIDGRHRYEACLAAGVEPRFREWHGQGSLVSFVFSLNLKRRHLTDGQKAMVAADAIEPYKQEARKRQLAGLKNVGESVVPANLQKQAEAAEQVAREAGVSCRYVYEAMRLKEDVPLVADMVKEGLLNIPAANAVREITEPAIQQAVTDDLVAGNLTRHTSAIQKRAAELRRDKQLVELPPGKYRVIYADPPALLWPAQGVPDSAHLSLAGRRTSDPRIAGAAAYPGPGRALF
jgi:hypothetical protein